MSCYSLAEEAGRAVGMSTLTRQHAPCKRSGPNEGLPGHTRAHALAHACPHMHMHVTHTQVQEPEEGACGPGCVSCANMHVLRKACIVHTCGFPVHSMEGKRRIRAMFPTNAQEYSPRCPAGQRDGGWVAGIPSSPVCAKQWQTQEGWSERRARPAGEGK